MLTFYINNVCKWVFWSKNSLNSFSDLFWLSVGPLLNRPERTSEGSVTKPSRKNFSREYWEIGFKDPQVVQRNEKSYLKSPIILDLCSNTPEFINQLTYNFCVWEWMYNNFLFQLSKKTKWVRNHQK